MKNWKRLLPLVAVPLIFLGIGLGEILSNSGKIPVDAAHKVAPWPKDVVKRLAEMPTMDNGRVKPVETLASYHLLGFHGTRTLRLKFTDGSTRTLNPTEWLLDTLFFPEHARFYPLFVVDDPQAVAIAGVTPHEARRQRYSFDEVGPALPKLLELRQEFGKVEAKDRQPQQQMIYDLAESVAIYDRMLRSLDWAREGFPRNLIQDNATGSVPYSSLSAHLSGLTEEGGENLMRRLNEDGMAAALLAPYTPPTEEQKEWMHLGHMIYGSIVSDLIRDRAKAALADWEQLATLRGDPAAFGKKLDAMVTGMEADADKRGQEWRVPVEVFYNKADFVYRALLLFMVAFLCQCVSWLCQPQSGPWKAMHRTTWITMGLGLAWLITGMVTRNLIMNRWLTSAVTNLYETILFITAFIIVVGLLAELFTKRKIALPVVGALAVVGMFLALRYEVKQGEDTMAPLQAVLNTNFWLSIHVTTINIGYSAGILCAAFSGVYLVARLFDPGREDKDFFKTLTNCAYGVICFGLLFSLVGTILGGLWANDSWGRFWGWDPKENGALMIVLCFLIILHARLGGYIKEFGLHILSVLTAAVVAFSWWHVNLLGVGLHSYGFTSGIKQTVFAFYGLVSLVGVIGVLAWFRARWHAEDTAAGAELEFRS